MSTFASTLAVDENGYIANGATGKIYAPTDTAAAIPLDITDLNGIAFAGNQLVASGLGVLPTFRTNGYQVVDWVSGSFRIPIPCIDMIPSGGTTGQILTKNGAGNFDSSWKDSAGAGLPIGGTTGQILTKNSPTIGDATWQDPTSGASGDVIVRRYNVTTSTYPVLGAVTNSQTVMWIGPVAPPIAINYARNSDLWMATS